MSQLLNIEVSAPGKVIIHGEHSVVYGKLALAASLNRRIRIQLTETLSTKLNINCITLNAHDSFETQRLRKALHELTIPVLNSTTSEFTWQTPEYIDHDLYIKYISNFLKDNLRAENNESTKQAAYLAFFYLYFGILSNLNPENINSCDINITTELNISSGTGSSAAYCVALAGTFIRYLQIKYLKNDGDYSKDCSKKIKISNESYNPNCFNESELNIISKWALAAERIMHGNPSGIDTSVCTFGSLVEFRKKAPLKLIKITSNIRVMLINTKIPRDTKKMVLRAAELKNKYPTIVDNIFNAMDDVTKQAVQCIIGINESNSKAKELNIKQNNTLEYYSNLQELFHINQCLLKSLGVSHPSIDRICEITEKYKLTSKLTGAGGGGYVICLLPPTCSNETEKLLADELNQLGYDVSITDIGSTGVQIDKILNC